VIIDFLKERINGKPKVSRAQVLASRPVRNPIVKWDREARDAETPPVALLRIPRRSDRFGNLVAKWFRLPEFRKLELDEIGSDVWEMCDGTNSVESLTKAICTKYRLNRRQSETSVTAYLRMLAERRLIALKSNRGSKTVKAAKTAPDLQRRQKRA
jgi:hypothetical protein